MRNPKIIAFGILLIFVAGCASSSDFSIPADPDAIVDVSKVSVLPKNRHMVAPVFPRELKEKKIAGSALIFLVIRKDGRITDVEIARATDPLFGAAAKAAVEKWTYYPATIRGQAVNCRVGVPISFNIE